MKNTIKTIITVLVVVGCGFICLISFGVYLSETDYMEYEIGRMISPVIKNAEAEYLGSYYNGEEEEGYSYYKVGLTIENNSNYDLEENELTIHFETFQGGYSYLREYEEENFFDLWDNGRYYPAGKKARLYKIVRVEEGCTEIDAVYKNYETDEEQRIPVILKKV